MNGGATYSDAEALRNNVGGGGSGWRETMVPFGLHDSPRRLLYQSSPSSL